MLVLDRKDGQVIRINDDIRIIVVGHRHGRIKIGIDCDREKYRVMREEVYLQNKPLTLHDVLQEKKEAK